MGGAFHLHLHLQMWKLTLPSFPRRGPARFLCCQLVHNMPLRMHLLARLGTYPGTDGHVFGCATGCVAAPGTISAASEVARGRCDRMVQTFARSNLEVEAHANLIFLVSRFPMGSGADHTFPSTRMYPAYKAELRDGLDRPGDVAKIWLWCDAACALQLATVSPTSQPRIRLHWLHVLEMPVSRSVARAWNLHHSWLPLSLSCSCRSNVHPSGIDTHSRLTLIVTNSLDRCLDIREHEADTSAPFCPTNA